MSQILSLALEFFPFFSDVIAISYKRKAGLRSNTSALNFHEHASLILMLKYELTEFRCSRDLATLVFW